MLCAPSRGLTATGRAGPHQVAGRPQMVADTVMSPSTSSHLSSTGHQGQQGQNHHAPSLCSASVAPADLSAFLLLSSVIKAYLPFLPLLSKASKAFYSQVPHLHLCLISKTQSFGSVRWTTANVITVIITVNVFVLIIAIVILSSRQQPVSPVQGNTARQPLARAGQSQPPTGYR